MTPIVRRVALVVALAGCHARAEGPAADPPDAGTAPTSDAPPGPPDARSIAADNPCGVASDQGDLGDLDAIAGVRSQGGTSDRVWSLFAPSPNTPMAPPDAIFIELWDGYGGFGTGPAAPGTYPITGDELDYATCGVCAFTLADVVPGDGPTRILLARSGTIIVHEVGGPALSVEVVGATFGEVDEDFEPVGTNCPSPLARARLDGTL